MYEGTLIDDLMSAVERAEQRATECDIPELETWCAMARQEIAQLETALLGVA